MTRPRNASLAFILVTLLLDTLGIGLIIPVFPSVVFQMVGNDVAAGSRYYGIFISVYAVMQFVFAPIVGGLSDRLGRRSVLLTSLLGAALDYVLLWKAPTLGWLFVGRVISGITGASFSTATAYIADVTPPEKRAQSFGMVGAAFGLGFIIGPAIGGLLGGLGNRVPFAVAALLNLLNFLYGLFILPESLSKENRRPFSLVRSNPFGSLLNLRRHPVVLGLAGTLVCAYMAQQMLQSVWALYGKARYNWTELNIGASLAVVGIATAVVQGALIRPIMPRLGERRALILGMAIGVFAHLGYALATRGWMMYAIIVPSALGGLGGPAVQALITQRVGPSEQGEVQGSLSSLQSVTAIVGPIVATWAFSVFGAANSVPHVPGAPFFLSAGILTVGLLLTVRLFARNPERIGETTAPASIAAPPAH